MNYDYNSDLEFKDRVTKVASEIKRVYPLISIDDAIKAAAISNPINGPVTVNDKFDRLYRIMLVIGRDNVEFIHVFNDSYNLYDSGILNDKYVNLMGKIIDYMSGQRDDFPFILEADN